MENKKYSLDLGCGNQLREFERKKIKYDEYFGVDIIETNNPKVKRADLFVDPIPFDSEYFDLVTAIDFIEHVPRVVYFKDKIFHPFIHVMNEVYRVLKPGGEFFMSSPMASSFFWNDPTHVNPITRGLFPLYFATTPEKGPKHPWAKDYGFIGNFKVISEEEEKYKHFGEADARALKLILQKI